MNVLYIYSDSKQEWNCAEWRCKIPCDAINRTDEHHARMVDIIDATAGRCHDEMSWADIVVIQRNLFSGVLGFVYHWRSYGKTIVLDVDDAYRLMPNGSISAKFWRNKVNKDGEPLGFDPFEHMQYGARLVNAMTMPSRLLMDDWKDLAPVYMVPNYPDLSRFNGDYVVHPKEHIVIGWGGSWSHIDSFQNSSVVPAIKHMVEKYGAEFQAAGGDVRLQRVLKMKDLRILPWTSYGEWIDTIRGFDIGIAPLSGMYDRYRSDIKVLEYMLCKVPWIASNEPPYQHLAEYGSLVGNQTKYWDAAFEYVINHPDQERIEKAYAYAMAQGIDQNIHRTIETYQKIIDDRRHMI